MVEEKGCSRDPDTSTDVMEWSGEKPILIYDGNCGFCKLWIARWKSITGNRIEYAPYQQVSKQFPEISTETFRKSVQFVHTDRSVHSGADAVFRALAAANKKRWLLWSYQNIPGFAPVSEWLYRIVADHRPLFSTFTRLFWGKHLEPSTYVVSSSLFMKLVAVVYFVAFVSLAVQIKGLVGNHGILPASGFLDYVHQRIGNTGYRLVPTIFWVQSSDFFLQAVCWIGALFSIFLFLGIARPAILVLLWAFYLSLCAVCRDFLAFQWDVLLLEVGALTIFLSPPQLKSRLFHGTPAILFLLRWLLFRLTFSSGIVKLLSRDPTWRNLTALSFHYETQPLPTPIAWYVHHLPLWFHKFCTAGMFFMEVLIPFLIFCPRRLRIFSFYFLLSLQILILLTGNYAFFNLLTISLCILLLDDAAWPKRLREKVYRATKARKPEWPKWLIVPFAVFIFFASAIQMCITLQIPLNPPLYEFDGYLEPFRSINRYGLFAVMTTKRPEIIIEGSNDGTEWKAYEFKYKPGDPARRPPLVAPHQPRLDWQMWFAALGNYQDDSWFLPFCQRLLEGSPDVLSLLLKNPFPYRPPHFLRAIVYQYHFTDSKTKSEKGFWWNREIEGSYCPVLFLRDGQLEAQP